MNTNTRSDKWALSEETCSRRGAATWGGSGGEGHEGRSPIWLDDRMFSHSVNQAAHWSACASARFSCPCFWGSRTSVWAARRLHWCPERRRLKQGHMSHIISQSEQPHCILATVQTAGNSYSCKEEYSVRRLKYWYCNWVQLLTRYWLSLYWLLFRGKYFITFYSLTFIW